MRRYKGNVKLLIIIVTLCHWHDVRGKTLKNDKSEDNFKEKALNTEEDETEEGNEAPFQSKFEAFKKVLQENGGKNKNTENTETHNFDTSNLGTLDSDSDTPNTIHTRVQELPLKIALQFLTAKHGLSGSLDKAKQGGSYIYQGTKDAVKTMIDFVGEGIGNTRFLLFGGK